MSEPTNEATIPAPDAAQAAPALSVAPASPADAAALRQTCLAALHRVLDIVVVELQALPVQSGQEALGQARSILAVCNHALEQGVQRI